MGDSNTQETGLAAEVGKLYSGEGSDAQKAGEALDLEVALIDPEVEETELQDAVEKADDTKGALDGMNDALDDGLYNTMQQFIAPFLGEGCPAGSDPSTGNSQQDTWNYIAELNAGEGLF